MRNIEGEFLNFNIETELTTGAVSMANIRFHHVVRDLRNRAIIGGLHETKNDAKQAMQKMQGSDGEKFTQIQVFYLWVDDSFNLGNLKYIHGRNDCTHLPLRLTIR